MDYHIDAKNKKIGRLASEIASILQGKKNPSYSQNMVSGDRVLLENCDELNISGKKLKQKIYYRHTGYVGHLKSKTLGQVMEKHPKRVIGEAVRRMLPKNFLNSRRLKNLIFIDSKK
ncbi:MAG: 50S ribosomal protein L13 [Patescibacteria group bacterium]